MRTGNPLMGRKYGHSKQCNEVVQHLSQCALSWAVLGNKIAFIQQRGKFFIPFKATKPLFKAQVPSLHEGRFN